MFKLMPLLFSLAATYSVSAKTISDTRLTAEDLSNFSMQDQRLFKASFPDLIEENATKGAAVVATIGFSSNCTFNASVRTTPIQDAIDFTINTYTELRLVEGVYDEENITLDDRDMVIKGAMPVVQTLPMISRPVRIL
ncbi:hypothetical protein GCM10011365_05270 [Marinicella pacifica]|uniref:Uncharacterized protein n=1 Tax=Marinicella pacifica TaxID=1171543 RepID=A0A917FJ67_9GAMM|nr:hypothetical protein [Marinicella pacifica]GGF87147.1 hypothetical protein GCM10011365_05270 [Marinicella pacifica]